MEEILASIRRIISDDGDGDSPGVSDEPDEAVDAFDHGAEEESLSADEDDDGTDADMTAMMEDTAAEEAADGEDDVFELTGDMAANDPGEESETVAADFDFDALDIGDAADEDDDEQAHEPDVDDDVTFADPPDEPVAEDPPAPEPTTSASAAPASGLLSPEAQSTASAAFGALASTMLSHSGGARTLEQIVEDLLRPLLKAWLDEQLPPLVERLVREEIERVARRAG